MVSVIPILPKRVKPSGWSLSRVNLYKVLPNDVLGIIFKYLIIKDLFFARRVCKRWRLISAKVWIDVFKNNLLKYKINLLGNDKLSDYH